jgi:hypothetical protein
LAILILGVWAAIVPFVGPFFGYAFLNNQAWYFTYQRLYLDILPGALAFIGGALLLVSANRGTTGFGAWLVLVSGIWLVIGLTISGLWGALPGVGPALGSGTMQSLEYLGYFYGTGAIITALAGIGVGRLSMRSLADARLAHDSHISRQFER